MNNTKITFTGTVQKRWKKALSSGKEMVYIAVTDGAAKYPTVFQFTAKSIDVVSPYKVGSEVEVTAWVNGREWKKSDTESVYFTDLNIDTIKAVDEKPEGNATDNDAGTGDGDDMPF